MIDEIPRVVFAIALFGHGIAHAVATIYLGRQVAGSVRAEALPVRSWLLPALSPRAAAAVAIVFWLPAAIGFLVASVAMLDLVLGDLPWSAIMVAGAALSAVGIAFFSAIWPGGEARLRPLHVFLALGMDLIILATQLVFGWPAAD